MSEDAEFDAFLKGEGALARQLQALAQPSPAPALDAAILADARTALAEERPAAANDAAPPAQWQPPPALSWRWRVPAGIAATLLVGLIARQSFESDWPQVNYDAPTAEAPAPAPVVEPATAVPAAQPAAVTGQIASAPARPALKTRPVTAPARAAAQMEAPAVESAPAPAPVPAPPAPAAPGTGTMTEALERVTVTGSTIAPAAAQEVEAEDRRAAERVSNVASLQRPVRPRIGKPDPAAQNQTAVPAESAALMLERVERLLQEGHHQAAMQAWEALQRTYPDYPVPDAIREKLAPQQP